MNVLIIDDNPADVELMRDALAETAARTSVTVAENGREAMTLLDKIAAYSAQRPAGILLDLNMPGIDGRKVLAYVKNHPQLTRIPTIILTSSSSSKDRDECLAMGADAFLTKPGTLQGLTEMALLIHNLLAKGPEQHRFNSQPPDSPFLALARPFGIRQFLGMRGLVPALGW